MWSVRCFCYFFCGKNMLVAGFLVLSLIAFTGLVPVSVWIDLWHDNLLSMASRNDAQFDHGVGFLLEARGCAEFWKIERHSSRATAGFSCRKRALLDSAPEGLLQRRGIGCRRELDGAQLLR
jgi:hypothetical protein